MLDQETKKRIDDCRNILLGKVPDPKSQVEQITIAMIYKFMYDMDKESIDMGGVSTYFVGEYEKYSWANIFNPRIGGNEMIELYGEGIVKMNLNPNIPQLFRDIFKNAYLPYRDPETLKLFLKGINEFHYSHSEKLGDAFEYLLSVLGSQGDAGQFRTPRHIIDFIVELLQPKKNERILDPACGTSGFLISSYKHILRNNTKKNLGDLITPDERNKLVENISGYDISPDMVRLSLVNLYLHNFSNPKIYEYDSLTSEDRWNEYFDVILANPPFMSPKGGIKPHKRFSIQSNRAEVLFVDYIMEHLTPKGRSGIVVPEGIIFQSGTAYKSLRKTLVEKCLVGVISLPSGVFQPYSGVKTSILILDKELSQKTDKIFFGKIDNDGFDLGAQRREIEKNDLPVIKKEVTEYLDELRKGKVVECEKLTYVPKEQILSSSDIGLSYDRYVSQIKKNIEIEYAKLGECCDIFNGSTPIKSNNSFWNGGDIPWFTIEDIRTQGQVINYTNNFITKLALEKTSVKLLPKKSVLLCCTASVGACCFTNIELTTNQQFNGLVVKDKYLNKLNPKFLFWVCSTLTETLIKVSGKTSFNFVSVSKLKEIEIPLPPIEVQEEIVRELEQYQKIIDGAKQVVDNYKPVIDIDPIWEMKELGKVLSCIKKQIIPNQLTSDFVNYVGLENIESQKGNIIGDVKSIPTEIKSAKFSFVEGDILYGKLRPNLNKVALPDFDGICSTDILVLRVNDFNIPYFYYSYLRDEHFNQEVLKGIKGSQLPRIDFNYISKITIPAPPLEIQQSIVDRIEGEGQIIEGNKKLIEIYTKKIQDRINKIWGE
jgi:type I restriction enzyme M protein